MSTENENVKNIAERILYVEPNDVYGMINGVPVTPDYTDMCVSFDLVVETLPRNAYISAEMSNTLNEKTEHVKTYTFSWTSYKFNSDSKNNEVSFMEGERYGDTSFLTTYYTDINFNDYQRKNIVEGLGVESVTVSFETYYTPTIKMRFIDVRGASTFGREEISHVDEKLKNDSIWGCFFTFPYPKFKLQIKGFYGHPVTYQLTLLDFRAAFNSNTGNFEIDTTFLGYDYGIMADVPTAYLIAAPYSKYVGADYWNQKVNSEEWRLSDGNSPKKLFDILTLINKAMREENTNENGENLINGDDGSKSIEKSQERERLIDIQRKYNNIITYIKDTVKDYYVVTTNTDTGNYIIFNPQGEKFWNDVSKIIQNFYNFVNDFIDNYAYDSGELSNLNFLFAKKKKNENFGELIETLSKYKMTSPQKSIFNYKSAIFRTGIENLEYNIFFNTIVKIEDKQGNPYSGFQGINPGDKKETCQAILIGNVEQVLQKMINSLSDYESYEESENAKKQEEIDSYLSRLDIYQAAGLLPTIYNVFKTILCHFETLTHMIYECKRKIETQITGGMRTPEKLGLSGLELLDCTINENIPAWATIGVTETKRNTEDDEYDSVSSPGWVGDFKGETEWEEAKLVEGLSLAALHVLETMPNKTSSGYSSAASVLCLPSDVFSETFPSVALHNPYVLGEYLGIRAAALFGIVGYDEDAADALGKADALNMYSRIDRNILKNRFITWDNWKNIIKNTPLTINEGENNREYTINPGCEKENARILTSEGDDYKYTYSECVKKNPDTSRIEEIYPMVPVVEGGEKSIMGTFDSPGVFLTDNSSVFRYIRAYYTVANNKRKVKIYYRGSMEKFLKTNNLFDTSNGKIYENDAMFNIYGGGLLPNYGSFFTTQVSLLNNQKMIVGDYTDDYSLWRLPLKQYWRDIENDDIGEKYLLTDVDLDKTKWGLIIGADIGKKPTEENILLDYDLINIFYSPYYYKQNESNFTVQNDLYRDAAKCLLFLSTCGFDIKKTIKMLSANTEALFYKIPYGAMLLVGGLIWRSWQKEDCINYPEGQKIFQDFQTDKFTTFIGNNTLISKTGEDEDVIAPWTYLVSKTNPEIPEGMTVIKEIEGVDFDINVANKLVAEFVYFLNNKWALIRNTHEQTMKSSNPAVNKTPYTFNTMVEYLKTLDDKQLKAINNKEREYIGNNPVVMSLYEPVYIADSGWKWGNSDVKQSVTFKKSLWNSYIDGFCSKLEEISKYKDSSDDITLSVTDRDSDIKLAMYIYIKNLWNRWFIMSSEEKFSVANYMKHFIFMDSLYRNIGSILHINCEKLYDALSNINGKSMMFQLLSSITTEHNCLFFGFPDYFGFGDDEIEQANASVNDLDPVSKIADMFTPIPYTQKAPLSTSNKFVVMLIYNQSENVSDFNGYKNDGFDIFSHDESILKNIIPVTFHTPAISSALKDVTPEIKQVRRYGYNIPSFGVSFARQNNSLFKNIAINMSNPIATEQSIDALSMIAEKGGANDKSICFYGQDLFPVYSGYSYTCTVEMMGDAQIMPLMYFQLMNIPMFRGTYMIYSVTHTMRPGDMTTTFKGMKLSRNALPFAKGWYTNTRLFIGNDRSFSSGDDIYEDNLPSTWSTQHFNQSEMIKSQKAKEKHLSNEPPVRIWIKLHTLMEECLEKVREIYGKPITVTSGYRSSEVNSAIGGVTDSQHTKGEAADIIPTSGVSDLKGLFEACLTFGKFDQLIYETDSKGSKWIHISYVKGGGRKEVKAYIGGHYIDIKNNWENYVK